MPQLSKGDTFSNGEQVTHTRLNQLVDSATLLSGAITEQPTLTANTLAADDSLLAYDLSANALREISASDVLNSNLNTSFDTMSATTVSSKVNKDLVIVASDSAVSTVKSYATTDGLTVLVSSVGHELVSNMVLSFTASNSIFSGEYFITVLSADTFSYTTVQTSPVASSGTLTYVKKASTRVSGSMNVSNKFKSASIETGNITATGNASITGNVSIAGELNVTGTLKVNGSTGYMLYSVFEESLPTYSATSGNAWNLAYTSPDIIKPADEIWEFIIDTPVTYGREQAVTFRATNNAQTTTFRNTYWIAYGSATWTGAHWTEDWIINAGTEFGTTASPEKIKLSVYAPSQPAFATVNHITYMTPAVATGKFIIKKYKTA